MANNENELDSLMSKELTKDISDAHPQTIKSLEDHLVMAMGNDNEMIQRWLSHAKPQLQDKSPYDFINGSDAPEQALGSVIGLLRKILEQDSRIG